MSKTHFRTSFKADTRPQRVDREKGIIYGFSVCTVGEAKGHGVSLDNEFIATISKFGSELKQGLKMRFGHPSMCSSAVGTFLGRAKNFSVVGDQVLADMFLSNSAKDAPGGGDLYEYVLSLAETDADMFGTSIVFTPGPQYKRGGDGQKVYQYTDKGEYNEEWETAGGDVFVECESLQACDVVDEPAANDGGLFSAFSGDTPASIMTAFLDEHPEIFSALEADPSIVEVFKKHGSKIEEFMGNYKEYSDKTEKENAMSEDKAPVVVDEPEVKTDEPAQESGKAEDAPVVKPEVKEEEPKEDKPAAELSDADKERAEFARMQESFGAEVAGKVFADGGSYEDAQKLHVTALEKENKDLKAANARLSENSGSAGGSAAEFAEADDQPKKGLFSKSFNEKH